jgi:hypothetical protein
MTNAALPPNSHRRLLAEIFADAEDHGLGTWGPTFQAHPDKIDAACAFIDTRATLLAEKRLAPEFDIPDPADTEEAEVLALYTAVLEATTELLIPGANLTPEQIGLAAWNRLTTEQRLHSVGDLLGCYVTRVHYEQNERAHQEAADDPSFATCLDDSDMASAWDAAADHDALPPAEFETVVDRQVLINLLSEVDLLRRRLNTASADQ